MRGRELFKIFRPILIIIEAGLRFLPDFLVTLLLRLSRNIPTRFGVGIRYMLFKRISKHCGVCVNIAEGVYILNAQELEVGDHVSIHPMTYIDAAGGLCIGSNVSIAHSTTIMTSSHSYNDLELPIRDNPILFSQVKIEDDVWIGCAVRILSGVTVSRRTIVAAGSVVNRTFPAGVIVAGVPAKVIKHIQSE